MAGLMRREPHGEAADVFSRFDRLFDERVRLMPFRPVTFPRWLEAGDLIRVEEYREDGTLVVRADLPGIDPDKDVELTVADGMLHIQAERRQEEKREEKGLPAAGGTLRVAVPVAAAARGRDRGRHHRDLQGRRPGDQHPRTQARRGQDSHQQILTEAATLARAEPQPRDGTPADAAMSTACANPLTRWVSFERCRQQHRRRWRSKRCVAGSRVLAAAASYGSALGGRWQVRAGRSDGCPGARSRRSSPACWRRWQPP